MKIKISGIFRNDSVIEVLLKAVNSFTEYEIISKKRWNKSYIKTFLKNLNVNSKHIDAVLINVYDRIKNKQPDIALYYISCLQDAPLVYASLQCVRKLQEHGLFTLDNIKSDIKHNNNNNNNDNNDNNVVYMDFTNKRRIA